MNELEYLYKKNKSMKDFILLYKSMPCLWCIKSKEYHNRELRKKGYDLLVKKLKEIDPTADRISVVKKINSLRSSLRKEKRKVADLAKQGVPYQPRLWYYQLFDFLEGQERGKAGGSESEEENTDISVKHEEAGGEYDIECEEVDDPLQAFELHEDDSSRDDATPSPPPKKKTSVSNEFSHATMTKMTPNKKISKTVKLEEAMPCASHEDSTREDVFDTFGRNVAAKLRNIASQNNKQRLIAEKVINDALFLAEMGEITLAHSKMHSE